MFCQREETSAHGSPLPPSPTKTRDPHARRWRARGWRVELRCREPENLARLEKGWSAQNPDSSHPQTQPKPDGDRSRRRGDALVSGGSWPRGRLLAADHARGRTRGAPGFYRDSAAALWGLPRSHAAGLADNVSQPDRSSAESRPSPADGMRRCGRAGLQIGPRTAGRRRRLCATDHRLEGIREWRVLAENARLPAIQRTRRNAQATRFFLQRRDGDELPALRDPGG